MLKDSCVFLSIRTRLSWRAELLCSLLPSSFDAPIRLPANLSRPSYAQGFTIPNDYARNTALRVIILWESPATQCDFVLLPNILFRARAGQPRDFGGGAEGLVPVNASTSFTVTGNTITMAAPTTAHQTARVQFNITPTPGEFQTLQSGDAVNFGIFRDDLDTNDTCDEDLGIAGISIVYQKRP